MKSENNNLLHIFVLYSGTKIYPIEPIVESAQDCFGCIERVDSFGDINDIPKLFEWYAVLHDNEKFGVGFFPGLKLFLEQDDWDMIECFKKENDKIYLMPYLFRKNVRIETHVQRAEFGQFDNLRNTRNLDGYIIQNA